MNLTYSILEFPIDIIEHILQFCNITTLSKLAKCCRDFDKYTNKIIKEIIKEGPYRLVQTLRGHRKMVSSYAILLNGDIVTASYDKTLKIWDQNTGLCKKTLEGHTFIVNDCSVLPNGDILSASSDGTLRIWDHETYEELLILNGHTDIVETCAVFSDGDIVSGSRDKTIKIWSSLTGRCCKTLRGHTCGITTCLINSNDDIISLSSDESIKIWDRHIGQEKIPTHEHLQYDINQSSKNILLTSQDCTLKMWKRNPRYNIN